MKMRLFLCAAAFAAQGVAAADFTVTVRDQSGAPVADAIVLLSSPGAPASSGGETLLIDQRSEKFLPFVSLLRPGDRIAFHNSDDVLHHVYSFSPLKPFDQHVRPGETTESKIYEAVGIAAIGCNVHDDMLTYVYITDLPFAAKTGPDGRAKILGAPEGASELAVWHPRAKTRDETVTVAVDLQGDGEDIAVELPMRPERRRSSRY